MRSCFRLLVLIWLIGWTLPSLAEPVNIKSLSKSKWLRVTTDNFEIYTNTSSKKASLIALQLEKYRGFCALLLRLKATSSAKKTVLFLAKNRRTWKMLGLPKDLVAVYRNYPERPSYIYSNIEGFTGNSLRKGNPGRATVLNAIAFDLFDQMKMGMEFPLWFKRGFAHYLATYTETKNGIILGRLDAMQGRIYSVLKLGGSLIGFNSESLFQRKKLGELSSNRHRNMTLINRFYMHSFMTVHYFYADPERRKKMFSYLNLIRQGSSELEAFDNTFKMSFEELDKQLKRYSSQRSIYAREFNKEAVEKLLNTSNSAETTSTSSKEFLAAHARAINEFGESIISNQDKQDFFKSLKVANDSDN